MAALFAVSESGIFLYGTIPILSPSLFSRYAICGLVNKTALSDSDAPLSMKLKFSKLWLLFIDVNTFSRIGR